MTEGRQEAVSAVTAATGALESVRKELARLNKYGKRSRKLIAVDVVLTVALAVLGYVSVHADAAAHSSQVQAAAARAAASAEHQSVLAGCKAGNQTRAAEIRLWEHIYSLAGVSKAPPKQRKADNELIAYIRHTFAPRDCAALYRLP